MRLLILHLSDIHHRPSEDHLGRVDKLVGRLKDIEYELDCCLVAVTGDLAFTGDEAEYSKVEDLLEEIHAQLEDKLDCPNEVRWAYVPGNHDCNFRNVGDARNLIIDAVLEDPNRASDESYRDIALSVQDNFYDWLEVMPDSPSPVSDQVSFTRSLSFEDKQIEVLSLNTSWLSTEQESPGRLLLPVDEIEVEEEADTVIALLHHPFPWLKPDNRRDVRGKIEEVADLVLTGHEHDPRYYNVSQVGGSRSEYIEGSVFKTHTDSEHEGVNVVLVDTDSEKYRVVQLEWDDELYRAVEDETVAWEQYPGSRRRTGGGFELTSEIRDYLEDPGLNLTHRERERVTLSDIFVYPDLQAGGYNQQDSPLIRSDDVADRLEDAKQAIILGSENVGKTAFAKRVVSEYRGEGYVPLLVRGEQFQKGGETAVINRFKEVFADHYARGDTDRLMELDRDQRVVVIDDCDAARDNVALLLKTAAKFAGRVFVFSNNLRQRVQQVDASAEESSWSGEYSRFTINEFGHATRDKLIQRWFTIGRKEDWRADEEFAHRITRAKNRVDTILGNEYIPARPLYILSVLQAEEAAEPMEIRESTYGAFYEMFIKRALAEVSSLRSYDIKMKYLARLGYYFYEESADTIAEDEFIELHQRFAERKGLRLSFVELSTELLRNGILTEHDGEYRFRYDYLYYYFAAAFMAEQYDRDILRSDVRALAGNLHVEEKANILLFLTHLSNDPIITEVVIESAERIYEKFPEAGLTEGLGPFEGLDSAVRDAVRLRYVEGDSQERRQEVMRKKDEAERNNWRGEGGANGETEEKEEVIDPVLEINRATKAIEITGQILKNFPGSLDRDKKEELLRACYGVGRRILGMLLELLETNREELLDDIVVMLQNEDRSYDRERLRKRAKRIVFGLVHFFSYGIVDKVSEAVGAPELALTYDEVLEADRVPVVELCDCAVRLDHWEKFPEERVLRLNSRFEDKILPHTVLQRLVVNHFHLVTRPVTLKQRICEELDVDYLRVQHSDPRRRRMSPAEEGD